MLTFDLVYNSRSPHQWLD